MDSSTSGLYVSKTNPAPLSISFLRGEEEHSRTGSVCMRVTREINYLQTDALKFSTSPKPSSIALLISPQAPGLSPISSFTKAR